MKTSLILLSAALAFSSYGQTASSTSNQGTVPQDTPYSIVDRDANSRTWERTTYEQLPDGDVVPHINRYQEIATGLNFKNPDTGEWEESSEIIEPVAGGAVARHGQHKVIFAADLATFGAIDMEMPDGQQLQSHLLGLSYFDHSSGQSVFIAQATNSIGQLISSNQVFYDNAFTGVKAGVRYTYTRTGFEQDVILEEQPPAPEAYGLSSSNTVLQAFTEFISPPAPLVSTGPRVPGQLPDVVLCFGAMKMGRGRAFLMGNNTNSCNVSKEWMTLDGRQFLVEEVPMQQIAQGLQKLPAPRAALTKFSNSVVNVVSSKRLLPAQPLAKAGTNEIKVAGLYPKKLGFVLDYSLLNTSQTNYVFAADTTYFISGLVNISGSATIEGGTVIKYGANLPASIRASSINCLTEPYRPAIFTAEYDNSVGETISTAPLEGYYGITNLDLEETNDYVLKNLKFTYANQAISLGYYFGNNVTIQDCQFVNCYIPITGSGVNMKIYNSLFSGIESLALFDDITMDAEQCTIDGCNSLGNWISDGGGDWQNFTNCLLIGVTNNGDGRFVFDHTTNFLNDPGTFRTVGAGKHYLANGSLYTNAGTTNINPNLLKSLAQKTTYPPIVYSNIFVSTNVTIGPQAQRNSGAPDIGYHYDPIDYIVNVLWLTNSTLTVNAGTAVACYNTAGGFVIADGSTIKSIGTAVSPNWFTRYSSVQEQPITIPAGATPGNTLMVSSWHATDSQPNGTFHFTKFSCPSGGGQHLYSSGQWAYSNLLVQDCEFWSGSCEFDGNNLTTIALKNNLFARVACIASGGAYTNNTLSCSNSLFWNSPLTIIASANSNQWSWFNNQFYNTSLNIGKTGNGLVLNGYNAYMVNTNQLKPVNPTGDILTTNTFGFVVGPLGDFYQSTSSILINIGSVTANVADLYNFTTTTNQQEEGNSQVDIGYHYIALDGNGNILDNDSDGVPDWEDADPNNPNVGALNVTIVNPTDGSTVQ